MISRGLVATQSGILTGPFRSGLSELRKAIRHAPSECLTNRRPMHSNQECRGWNYLYYTRQYCTFHWNREKPHKRRGRSLNANESNRFPRQT